MTADADKLLIRPTVRRPGRRRRQPTDTSRARTRPRLRAVNESFGSGPPSSAPTCQPPRTTPICSLTVRLAGSRRPEQHDVLAAVEEVELAEVLDQGLLDAVLEGEVELLERFSGGEAGGPDATLAAVRFA